MIVTGRTGVAPHAPELALTAPEYEPAARPVAFTDTLSVAGVFPLKGLTESQPPLLVAVARNCPAAPLQAIDTLCGGGPGAPTVAAKEREPALNVNAGTITG